MRIFHGLGAALLAGLLLTSIPAHAESAPRQTVSEELAEAGVWLGKVDAAINVGTEAVNELMQQLKPKLEAMRTRQQAEALAPEARRQLASGRESLARSAAMLNALKRAPAPAILNAEGLTPQQIIADVEAQNVQFQGLLNAMDQMFASISAENQVQTKAAALKLMRGSFTVIDSRVLLIRNRQALFKPSDSNYQTLGVKRQLYVIMASIARAWITDTTSGPRKPGQAEGELRGAAAELRRLTEAGRTNLAREIAEVDTERRLVSLSQADQNVIERSRQVMLLDRQVFEIGDQLAPWTEQVAKAISGRNLKGQPVSDLLSQLTTVEGRLRDIGREQSRVMAGTTGPG